jgi:GNAT superfamily N-acetyltransferase
VSTSIRPMVEADRAEARRILCSAFGTFLGAPDPEHFWADRDYVFGRFGAEHVESYTAELDGAIVGGNFVTRWGSVGFFGPLMVRPDLWNRRIAQPLVEAVANALDAWGVSHAGLFTFAESAKHIHLYGKFGFYPRFLTAIMAAPARAGGDAAARSRYSELSDGDRRAAEALCREVSDALYAGLDLSAEIRTATARRLGDTLLLWERPSRLAGFAVCHWGPASEAGDGCCFVKFGAVQPGPRAAQYFAALLDAGRALAAAVGMPKLRAGVNLAREEAYRTMAASGFRTEIQGVTMHRPNDWGYSRRDLFVLDDWR